MSPTANESPATGGAVDDTLMVAREAYALQRAAEVAAFVAVADWADAHRSVEPGEVGERVGDPYGSYGVALDLDAVEALPGGDQWLELGGPGCPIVSEFAVVELAAALGLSTDGGRRLVGDAVEARHRLPRIMHRLVHFVGVGGVAVWKVRKIAQLTRRLTADGADFVDRNLAYVVHKVGFAAIEKLVAEAVARFDPELAEMDRLDALERRHVTVEFDRQLDPVTGAVEGTIRLHGELDLDDALDLDAALSNVSAQLVAAGCTLPHRVRRSLALGELARRQIALDLTVADGNGGDAGPARPMREVVLHVHLAEAALAADADPDDTRLHLARVEAAGMARRFVTADQVRDWCGGASLADTTITVKPVIDLNEAVSVDAYEIPDRIVDRVRLTHPTCVFPHCTRPSRSADLDHIDPFVPMSRGGPPGQTSTENLAPLCRRHHRAKTHPGYFGGRWRYDRTGPASFTWTSPAGFAYDVGASGTVAR